VGTTGTLGNRNPEKFRPKALSGTIALDLAQLNNDGDFRLLPALSTRTSDPMLVRRNTVIARTGPIITATYRQYSLPLGSLRRNSTGYFRCSNDLPPETLAILLIKRVRPSSPKFDCEKPMIAEQCIILCDKKKVAERKILLRPKFYHKESTKLFSDLVTMDFAYAVTGRYMSGIEAILPADSKMATDEG
jgi:hypothetical protein